jgi:voltage-gated potassium channel
MGEHKSLWRIVGLAVLLQVFGTVSLSRFESISYTEASYQTLLILLAHFDHYGFHDDRSRMVVIFLIVSSLVVVAYLLKWFAEYMIGIGDNVRKRRMKTHVDKLKDHQIICGLGRVGAMVVQEMKNEEVPFVGIDRDPAKVDEVVKTGGGLAFCADSTLEEALLAAGIKRARGLVASLGEDSQNLFVVLAARSLNPDLYIVARANREDSVIKMKRAGADRVAMPYQIGGYHMANMALRPSVVDYLDIMTNSNGTSDLEVEEMVVGEKSKLAGRYLGKALAEGGSGATVIAINGADGTSLVRPTGKETIYPGDRLILLGAKEDLTAVSALIR